MRRFLAAKSALIRTAIFQSDWYRHMKALLA